MRRSSIAAVKKMAASFASSDGWMPKPPTPNQRRVPLTGAAEEHRDQRSADDAEQRPDQTFGCR